MDLGRGESFGFLGFDFRRIRSRRGAWRANYTPSSRNALRCFGNSRTCSAATNRSQWINGRDGAYTCIFSSYEQCMMTATPGTGGSCVRNPWYAADGPNSPGNPSTTTGQGKRAKR